MIRAGAEIIPNVPVDVSINIGQSWEK
jgi:hypothetical protein